MLRSVLVMALRPLLWLVLGLSIGGRGRLPVAGPAIVAPNHNSHVDVLIMLAAFKRRALPLVSPVGAADYFAANRALAFIAYRILGVVPLDRTDRRGDPLAAARAALEAGRILIVFPEGTRGRPEELGPLKGGITRLARDTGAPIVPAYLQGAGRILPKGTRIPVPFTSTLLIGRPIAPSADRGATMAAIAEAYRTLAAAAPPLHWH